MGAWFNSVQREILNVLAKAGIPQSATKEDQLAEAITKMVASAGYLPTGYSYSKVESDDRYQPKGNYAPTGDYATNTALNNGLNQKFDKAGGKISGPTSFGSNDNFPKINLEGVGGESTSIQANVTDASYMFTLVNRDKTGNAKNAVRIPNASGTAMLVGDYGWGATKKEDSIRETDFGINKRRTFGVFWHDADAVSTPNGHQYGGGIFFGRDPSVSTHMLYSPDWSNRLYMRSPKSSTTMNPWVEFYSTENAVTDRNGLLRVSANDELSDYPVGSPIPWAQSTAPSGFLVCNGQSFNKTTYPLLAKAYPSGILPDLRGEFIRGLDAGRNIDSGRAVLSAQGDAIQNIKGTMTISAERTPSSSGTGVLSYSPISGTAVTSEYYQRQIQQFDFDASRVVRTANENRPRNIAFLYIVRAA
ncbi:tail fiber protein [Providencia rettgeri]|nr:tail fiber protein [Providencia rettgeri]